LPSAGLTAHGAERADACRSRARAAAKPHLRVLEANATLGEFGHTFRRSLVQRFADASLAAALAGVRVPALRAEVQARARLAPGPAQLARALLRAAPASAHGTH
jgi:hypothetical protein